MHTQRHRYRRNRAAAIAGPFPPSEPAPYMPATKSTGVSLRSILRPVVPDRPIGHGRDTGKGHEEAARDWFAAAIDELDAKIRRISGRYLDSNDPAERSRLQHSKRPLLSQRNRLMSVWGTIASGTMPNLSPLADANIISGCGEHLARLEECGVLN